MAKDPIVEGRNPESTRLESVAEVIWVWLRKRLQPNIPWRLRDSNYVMFLKGDGVEYWGTSGRLEM